MWRGGARGGGGGGVTMTVLIINFVSRVNYYDDRSLVGAHRAWRANAMRPDI